MLVRDHRILNWYTPFAHVVNAFLYIYRNSCDFLACEKRVNRAVFVRAVDTSSSRVGDSTDSTQLLLQDKAYYTAYTHHTYNTPSLQVVTAYQSTYRTATHYLDSLLTPVSSYAVKYALGSYIGTPAVVYTSNGGVRGAGGGSVWYEVYKGCRCVLHVLLRTLPATALSKMLAFIG